ncbi:inhibitor of nuclear factor kappa-B kinase subunit alpha-like isoform X2 [Cotesia glomerata]|uniref:inhibitor of nuclear factor kappa-B kinase subunit alpha-like isoform X2 n=1 Tax=Cotesia glomerata TaxID=32391 RepID=UPI001D02ABF6|nr:inhibitor of nuclear factor kappa-B kinase subunit alpha-like isoform X2 [Cotesia glomerata]
MLIMIYRYSVWSTVQKMLNKCDNVCGVSGKEALKIMHDISSAVEYLHQEKTTHRDLKPDNIVLQQIGSNVIYKLIDLGYAKELSDASIAASVVGTLNYLAPELLWKESYSCSVDYWSLGILFYEIITGTRPFLPHMQITTTWMDLIRKKNYKDISARTINDQIVFSQDIDEPCTIPKCIKNDLAEWFRLVLQWDPRRRGKIKEDLVVFSKLKEILEKKVTELFIVPRYKFESYIVDSNMTIDDLKLLIFNKEKIEVNCQILTDTMGNILDDQSWKKSDVIMVFSNDLCLTQTSDQKFYNCINEALAQPRKKFNYYQAKSYCGAIMFFVRKQIEIYRTYILALSIMIDFCGKKFNSVNNEIEELSSGVEKLVKSLEETEGLIKNIKGESCESFEALKGKIGKFLEQKKKMKKKFNVLKEDKEKLKEFVEINWMEGIEEPLDRAQYLVNTLLIADRNTPRSPFEMVQLFFRFLKEREKKLSDQQLVHFQNKITQFLKELSQLKEVLKSFKALLNNYNEELTKIRQEVEILHETSPACSTSQSTKINTSIDDTDSVIYNSIFITNMLGSLLTEMDTLKSKFADLAKSDE